MSYDIIIKGRCLACADPKDGVDGWRILDVRPTTVGEDRRPNIAAISIGAAYCLPEIFSWETVNANLLSGTWLPTDKNLCPPPLLSLDEITDQVKRDRYRVILESNHELIRPILALGWRAYSPSDRNSAIRNAVLSSPRQPKPSGSWIKNLLIEYWRTGSLLALCPNYSRCGAKHHTQLLAKAIEKGELPKTPIRSGMFPKHAPLSEDIVGKEGRGSWAIPLTAIPYIKESISSYFKAPINQANIKLSLERYHSVPWEGIRLWINSCLSDHPRYKEIRPSAKQIRRIGRDVIEITEILRSALGDKIMPLKYRAKSGDYRDVTWGAGSLYEADPHDIDLHFIDKETMMPIGRGKLILVVDRASTMITGFDFSSDDPDFDYMAQSFDCAFSNKPKWCLDNLGHTIGDNDWPCEGVCDMMSVDNLEMRGKAAQKIPELLADIGYTRSGRADDKPQVEVSFNLQNVGLVRHYSYGVIHGQRKRAETDPKSLAVVTPEVYLKGLVRWIIEDHSNRPFPLSRELHPDYMRFVKDRGLGLTPRSYWMWSIEREHGALQKYDPATMYPRLLRREIGSITDYGIELKNLVFDLPREKASEILKAATLFDGRGKIAIHYSGLSTNQVYIVAKDPAIPPIRCPLAHISRNFSNTTWAIAEIRWDERKGMRKISARAHDETAGKARAKTAADGAAAHAQIVDKFGSIKSRNAVALKLDPASLKNAQIEKQLSVMRNATEPKPADSKDLIAEIKIPKRRPNIYE